MTNKITDNPIIREIQKALESDATIDAAEGQKIEELLSKATPEERSAALQFLNEKCKSNPSVCSLFKDYQREEDRKIAAAAGLLGMLAKEGGHVSNAFGPGGLGSGFKETPTKKLEENVGGVGGLGTRGAESRPTDSGLGIGGIGLYGRNRDAGRTTGNIDLGGHRSVTIRGGLSKDVIGRIIRRHWAKIKFSYEVALIRNPNLEGKVVSKFAIDPDGKVSGLKLESDTIKDPQMLHDIEAVISQIRFPKPEGGGFVDVSYPLIFELKQ